MSVPESEKYIDDEKFKFLVVETFELKCYGFNLKNTDQQTTAKQIIKVVNNFIVNLGKLQGRFPNEFMVMMHGFTSWMKKCSHNNNEEYNSEEDINNDENKDFEYEEDDEGKHDEKVEKIEEVQEDEDVTEEEKEGGGVEKEGSDEDEE
jgi:hypothetical protein